MTSLLVHCTHGKEDPERATLAFIVGNVAASADPYRPAHSIPVPSLAPSAASAGAVLGFARYASGAPAGRAGGGSSFSSCFVSR